MHTCLSSTGGNYVFGTDAYDLFYITEETGCKYLFEMMNYWQWKIWIWKENLLHSQYGIVGLPGIINGD